MCVLENLCLYLYAWFFLFRNFNFVTKVKQFHPDVNRDLADSDSMIRRVIEAYEVLIFTTYQIRVFPIMFAFYFSKHLYMLCVVEREKGTRGLMRNVELR